MTIADLTHDEKVALAALLEMVSMADGEVTEPEAQNLGRIAAALGEDEYRALLDEADEKFDGVEALKEALAAIERQEARELIFGEALAELMESPATHPATELMEWLKTTWKIEVKEA